MLQPQAITHRSASISAVARSWPVWPSGKPSPCAELRPARPEGAAVTQPLGPRAPDESGQAGDKTLEDLPWPGVPRRPARARAAGPASLHTPKPLSWSRAAGAAAHRQAQAPPACTLLRFRFARCARSQARPPPSSWSDVDFFRPTNQRRQIGAVSWSRNAAWAASSAWVGAWGRAGRGIRCRTIVVRCTEIPATRPRSG